MHQVEPAINKYWPVVLSNCSSDLSLLLCSIYAPRCNPLNMVTSAPCRSLCTKVKRDCDVALKSLGMEWPSDLNCTRMPERNCVISSTPIGNVLVLLNFLPGYCRFCKNVSLFWLSRTEMIAQVPLKLQALTYR